MKEMFEILSDKTKTSKINEQYETNAPSRPDSIDNMWFLYKQKSHMWLHISLD